MKDPAPHRTSIPVRYSESDQMGVVHHAVYVHYFEVGRTELMKEHGVDYAEMERRGLRLAVIGVGLRYLAPARFGDTVIVETRLTRVERVRVRFEYRVLDAARPGRSLCEGFTELAALDRDLRPTRIPAEDRALLRSACSATSSQAD